MGYASSWIVLFALISGTPLLAQSDYRTEQSDALKVRYQVFKKLQAMPLQLGSSNPHQKAKFEAKDASDYIWGAHGAFPWHLWLLEFQKAPVATPGAAAADAGGDAKDATKEVGAQKHRAANFHEWATSRDPEIQARTWSVKAKEVPAKGKRLGHALWEYADTHKMTNGRDNFDQVYYSIAAVYDFPDRQVALVCSVPLKKGDKPEAKHRQWAEAMVLSVESIEVDAAGSADAPGWRDKYADADERKKALEAAKQNIQNINNWNYFTSPNYIVLFSWNAKKDGKEPDALKHARGLVDEMEECRKLYIRDFPLPETSKQTYPVLRVCEDYEEFQKYGVGAPQNAVGYFSPASKELVIFRDKDHMLAGVMSLETVAFHEGWHQYGNTFFGNLELHRWFDEGLGDYFGSYVLTGKTWRYEPQKGRLMSVKQQIARKSLIPMQELVTWPREKFYDARGADHYAQGYSFIDFLIRGKDKMGTRFDPAWANILTTYRTVCLTDKNTKKAVEKAFEGVDWPRLEETWIEWVKTYMK